MHSLSAFRKPASASAAGSAIPGSETPAAWASFKTVDRYTRAVAWDDWATAEEAVDATGDLGPGYNEWLRIVGARLARGEGDAERLRQVRARLRAEAEIARKQPVLQDKLPVLMHVLTSKENRENFAQAFTELSQALRTDEPATPAPAPS